MAGDHDGHRRRRESSTSRALGGADQVTVNDLTGTDVTRVNVDLAATDGGGDGSVDNVIVNGTAAADVVHVDSAAGQTTVVGARCPPSASRRRSPPTW